MRRHFSYANVVATLALVFAMSGTGLAAKHYLINSTKQINPKVLKRLAGRNGRTGATGPTGPAGPKGGNGVSGARGEPGPRGDQGERGDKGETGPKGPTGPEGPLVATLPSGKTERGAYGFASTRASLGGLAFTPAWATSYPIPLSFTPVIRIVKGSPTATCPGSVESPSAAAGALCIYEQREDVELDVENGISTAHFGFLAFAAAAEGENYEDYGTWAVTAP